MKASKLSKKEMLIDPKVRALMNNNKNKHKIDKFFNIGWIWSGKDPDRAVYGPDEVGARRS